MRRGWASFALERYSLLRRWRELAAIVAAACREVLSESCLEVYVVGGAAEGRLTALSDIDVVAVLDRPVRGPEALDLIVGIMEAAMDMGLPEEAPIDLKLLSTEEFEALRGRAYRAAVRVL